MGYRAFLVRRRRSRGDAAFAATEVQRQRSVEIRHRIQHDTRFRYRAMRERSGMLQSGRHPAWRMRQSGRGRVNRTIWGLVSSRLFWSTVRCGRANPEMRVVSNFPQVAIQIGEVARVTTPSRSCSGFCDCSTAFRRTLKDGIDFGFRFDIVRRGRTQGIQFGSRKHARHQRERQARTAQAMCRLG